MLSQGAVLDAAVSLHIKTIRQGQFVQFVSNGFGLYIVIYTDKGKINVRLWPVGSLGAGSVQHDFTDRREAAKHPPYQIKLVRREADVFHGSILLVRKNSCRRSKAGKYRSATVCRTASNTLMS